MSSSKAMAAMGLSLPDIVNMTLNVHNGLVEPTTYSYFWNALLTENRNQQTSISQFLSAILDRIGGIMKQKKVQVEEFQVLLNTLAYVVLSTTLTSARASVLEVSKAFQVQLQKSLFPLVEDTLRMIVKAAEDGGFSMDVLLRHCITLHLTEDFKEQNNILRNPALGSQSIVGSPFMRVFLLLKSVVLSEDIATTKSNLETFIGLLIVTLKTIEKIFPTSFPVAISQFQALMVILRSFIPYFTYTDISLKQKLLAALSGIKHWPFPCSETLYCNLSLLQAEIQSPGFNLLDSMLRESVVPQMGFDSQNESLWAQPLFYFMDSDSIAGCTLFRTLRMRAYDSVQDDKKFQEFGFIRGLDSVTQLQLLYHMLGSNLEGSNEVLLDVLSRLDPDKRADYFYKICIIAYDSVETDESQSERYRDLLSQMYADTSQKVGDDPALLKSLPNYPQILHIAFPDSLANHVYAGDSTSVFFPTRFGSWLETLIRQHHVVRDTSDPVVIKIMLGGNDRLIHSVITGYLRLLEAVPQFLEGVLIKWYIIAVDFNVISGFVARHDPWYCRYVFMPTRSCPPVVPWIMVNNPIWRSEDNTSAATGPGQMVKQMLESYARDATFRFPIQLFLVDCWEGDGSVKRKTMPLFGRLELSDRAFTVWKQCHGDQRLLDDGKEGDSRPRVLSQYMKTSMSGEPLAVISRDQSFDVIHISNIPLSEDPCFPCDPSTSTLEFYGHFSERKSKEDPDYHKCTISSIEITGASRGEKFYVLIDGEPYGPFWRLLITPPNPEYVLPIQTFFPLAI